MVSDEAAIRRWTKPRRTIPDAGTKESADEKKPASKGRAKSLRSFFEHASAGA
jgi:hypothetical protein